MGRKAEIDRFIITKNHARTAMCGIATPEGAERFLIDNQKPPADRRCNKCDLRVFGRETRGPRPPAVWVRWAIKDRYWSMWHATVRQI